MVWTPIYCSCVFIFEGEKNHHLSNDKNYESKRNAKWTNEFKFGRKSLKDDPLSDQSRCAIIPEIIAKVYDIILKDCQIKLLKL
jgi:hypothetical protein